MWSSPFAVCMPFYDFFNMTEPKPTFDEKRPIMPKPAVKDCVISILGLRHMLGTKKATKDERVMRYKGIAPPSVFVCDPGTGATYSHNSEGVLQCRNSGVFPDMRSDMTHDSERGLWPCGPV